MGTPQVDLPGGHFEVLDWEGLKMVIEPWGAHFFLECEITKQEKPPGLQPECNSVAHRSFPAGHTFLRGLGFPRCRAPKGWMAGGGVGWGSPTKGGGGGLPRLPLLELASPPQTPDLHGK